MPITLTFKTGKERVFPEATKAIRKGGVVVLSRDDGSEVGTFDAEQVVTVNGLRLSDLLADH